MTSAKKNLIDESKDSVHQFIDEWVAGRIDLPVCPCGSAELYEAYCIFCRINGESRPRPSRAFVGSIRHMPRWEYGEEARFDKNEKRIVRGTVTPPEEILNKHESIKPEEKIKARWLTDCCEKFKNALDALK
jgi:phage/plasmid-associated DNA primase